MNINLDDDDAHAYHARGVALLATGNAQEAVAAIERAVHLAADVPTFLANLAEAKRRAGDPRAGAAFAERALALDAGYATAEINLGCCRFDLGEHAAALAAFEALCLRDPCHAQAHAYRADALVALGRMREASAAYEHALALEPDNAHACANFGMLLIASSPERALELCQRAVTLAPDEPLLLNNLGRCLFELERMDEAMDAYADANQALPESATICCNIGAAWQESGDPLQAAVWYEHALARDPEFLDARIRAATLQVDHGDPETAAESLSAIVSAHPESVEAHLALARAQWETGDATAAIASYREAARLRPEFAHIHAALAQVLASAGDVEGAIAAYRDALAINPRNIGGLCGLAVTVGARLAPEELARISAMLEAESTREGGRALLHNALAHHYDASDDDANLAIAHATEANSLQWSHRSKRGWRYDAAQQAARADRMIATFNAALFARARGWGSEDARPVFVVGMPRSGTTLVEQILAAHPCVLGIGERTFAHRAFNHWVADAGSGPFELDATSTAEAAAWYVESLDERVRASGRTDAPQLIVDKMPDNYSLLGWIALMFPHARIIHSQRDLRDVAVSSWMTQFAQIEWACRFEHLAARMEDYRRLMKHWRDVLPLQLFETRYESLCAEPEAASRRLIDWLGLEWDSRCLDFHRNRHLVRTASVTQVRQPVHTRSVARWRRYEAQLEPLFAAIGPETVVSALRTRL